MGKIVDVALQVNTKELSAAVAALGAAVASALVAFGHSDLSSAAQTAFVSIGGLVVALVSSGLIKSAAADNAAKVSSPATPVVPPSLAAPPS